MMDMMWGMGGMMVLAVLFWAAVLVALAAAVWWLVRRGQRGPGDKALETLRERYARGEISREEFEARRRDLVA
jgi:putative membrane protein